MKQGPGTEIATRTAGDTIPIINLGGLSTGRGGEGGLNTRGTGVKWDWTGDWALGLAVLLPPPPPRDVIYLAISVPIQSTYSIYDSR